MVINEDILRRDTVQLIKQIDVQIAEATASAQHLDISPEQMRDSQGNWVMTPLLHAKATAYNTLVLLQTNMKK